MGIDLAGTHVSRKLVPVNWVSSGFLRSCYMLPLQNWQNMKPKKVVESFDEALQEVVAGFRTKLWISDISVLAYESSCSKCFKGLCIGMNRIH